MLGHELGQRIRTNVMRGKRHEFGVLANLGLLFPVLTLNRTIGHGIRSRLNAILLDSGYKTAGGKLSRLLAGIKGAAQIHKEIGKQSANDQEVQPICTSGRLASAGTTIATLAHQTLVFIAQSLALVILRALGLLRCLVFEQRRGCFGIGIRKAHITSRPPV